MTGRRGQGAGRPTLGAGLSRDQVLDAAMEILETDGVDRLTIRGLAGRLEVAATAIYWHVGNKEDLFDGLAQRVVARLSEVSADGDDPTSRIISIARALRGRLLEQPELVALVHRQGRTAELFQPARRLLVGELVQAGVDGTETALAVQAVLNLVIGSVLLDRQLERQPVQRRRPEELWSPGDAPGHPDLLARLSDPIDEHELFEFTMAAVVRAAVGGR
ncbi:MAG TPA: TetR family transcriptional regulator [Acidimicrobiales bacterium]|jgi:TetR/AcrR family tetracycline transcriptional repressor|nr:TetR family transcriptional regulator [Acidimicrobiales bacterium]